ncbi:PASTA domain-containing protein, partial [Flavobacteriaceae bacterium]|nr:PASTA domain-containing protein [Flavobacteriaceae bacterium]
QDSSNYNPNYPKGAVIEQDPLEGSQVKEGRKIYLILNPSAYRTVAVPDVIRRTFRQAKPSLEAVGFQIGAKIYRNDLGKNEVLQLRHNGQIIEAGTMLPKTSKIDLVLGNGVRK